MPPAREHHYETLVTWVGAAAGSTKTYAGYSREYTTSFGGKGAMRGSADKSFRGDPTLPNPEDLLVAALSSCHMLSYLALCALAGVEVISYVDRASGVMRESAGAGTFSSVTLRPEIEIAHERDLDKATELHRGAHASCFIASSVNFPVTHEPLMRVVAAAID